MSADDTLQRKGWTLPQKLIAAGEGAGAWGDEIGSRPSVDGGGVGRGHARGGRRLSGSSGGSDGGWLDECRTTKRQVGGSDAFKMASTFAASAYPGEGVEGDSISGKALNLSMFGSPTPVQSNLPRKRSIALPSCGETTAVHSGKDGITKFADTRGRGPD